MLLSSQSIALLLIILARIASSGEDVDGINSSSQDLLNACLDPITDDPAPLLAALKDPEVNINVQDPASGQTPLMASVLRGKADFVKILLEHGADHTIPEKDGYTPPHGAAFQGRVNVMKVLQKFGLSKQEFHKDGYLPFHRACWGRSERHSKFIEYMLKQGIVTDVNVKSKHGKSCRDMTSNSGTLAVLDKYKEGNDIKEL